MTAYSQAAPGGILSRERSIAGPNFNRWLVPPAALAIHLCIGMAYGFSVYWLPMTRLLTHANAAACASQSFGAELFTTSCNWTVPAVTPVFEIFIAVLGISAAIWGGWLEHAGPRKAGFYAALCWGGGLIVLGIAVAIHQLWLVYIVAVVCGIGQGIGYITPVSTLIKWFPDRRGMATGLAIMGYGGGALIGAPLGVWFMKHFAIAGTAAVTASLIGLGIIYFVYMCAGAFGFRVPPTGWRPAGWAPAPVDVGKEMITQHHVHMNEALKTPQFWLIWGVLCLNVTAGIGVISMASPMLQDVFGPKLLGLNSTATIGAAEHAAIVAAAAGMVGLLSLFNALGRFFWASLSDKSGRKLTYYVLFVIGIILYCLLPRWGHLGLPSLFVLSMCIIISMYGGGFSTLPAYLADIFGSQMVGAIHGRLITAWSVAGVIGPALIAELRQFELNHGVAHNKVYDITLYIMAALLLGGLICNFFVKPVDGKHHMTDAELARERALVHEDIIGGDAERAARGSMGTAGVLAWLAVGIPFLIGLFFALEKAAALF